MTATCVFTLFYIANTSLLHYKLMANSNVDDVFHSTLAYDLRTFMLSDILVEPFYLWRTGQNNYPANISSTDIYLHTVSYHRNINAYTNYI